MQIRLSHFNMGQCRTRILPAIASVLLGMNAHAATQSAPGSVEPVDLTGYWVSVISTPDWRLRMVTPAKGDFLGVQLTPAGTQTANGWDPAKDEAAGQQCKSHGAAGIMRLPGHLHISGQSQNSVRMDLDSGTQTRIFHVGETNAFSGEATWQGHSVAQWQTTTTGGLKVVTTNMKAGYLRKNGIPYSEHATLTEYYDVVREHTGDQWLIVTSVVEDPLYLQQPYTTNVQFKKQRNAAGWNPTPCSSAW